MAENNTQGEKQEKENKNPIDQVMDKPEKDEQPQPGGSHNTENHSIVENKGIIEKHGVDIQGKEKLKTTLKKNCFFDRICKRKSAEKLVEEKDSYNLLDERKKQIDSFRRKLKCRYWGGEVFRALVVLSCFTGLYAIICAIIGCHFGFKVDGLLAQILLVFLLLVLLGFAGFMVFRIIGVGRRYRASIARLDILGLLLNLNMDKDLNSKFEKELQMIARILECDSSSDYWF